jgi:hypothetical protein
MQRISRYNECSNGNGPCAAFAGNAQQGGRRRTHVDTRHFYSHWRSPVTLRDNDTADSRQEQTTVAGVLGQLPKSTNV